MNQQEYIDATKLADFQRCPQLYDYRHNWGYQSSGESMDLLFGNLLGSALETFEKALLDGQSHEDAHARALTGILEGSINSDGTSRFGHFAGTWRCLGNVPYRNEKGNPAKCPFSHKGRYFVPPAPELCSCGGQIEYVELWVPTKASKDIDKLVELFVGYSDAAKQRALIPASLNGKPLIEHFWEIPFHHAFMARPVILCGNLDAVKTFGQEAFVVDYKSTGKSLDGRYWASFSPNVQIDLYNMASGRILPNLDIKGVAIEAFSTSGETSTAFKLFRASPSQKAEMFSDTAYWLASLQASQDNNIWPRNRTACFMCSFQKVCSKEPSDRQYILDKEYTRAKWEPKSRQMIPLNLTGINSPSMPKLSTQSPTEPTSCDPSKMPNTTTDETSMSSMTDKSCSPSKPLS